MEITEDNFQDEKRSRLECMLALLYPKHSVIVSKSVALIGKDIDNTHDDTIDNKVHIAGEDSSRTLQGALKNKEVCRAKTFDAIEEYGDVLAENVDKTFIFNHNLPNQMEVFTINGKYTVANFESFFGNKVDEPALVAHGPFGIVTNAEDLVDDTHKLEKSLSIVEQSKNETYIIELFGDTYVSSPLEAINRIYELRKLHEK